MDFTIGDVAIGLTKPFFVMAGPCVIESERGCLEIADRLVQISQRTGVGMIFKASFDKANRSHATSYRGPGLAKGLEVLSRVRETSGLPVMTDVHEPQQATAAGAVVDCLQTSKRASFSHRPRCTTSWKRSGPELTTRFY